MNQHTSNMKRPTKTIKAAPIKKVSSFNAKLPKKIFKQTKIKNLPKTNRTIYV